PVVLVVDVARSAHETVGVGRGVRARGDELRDHPDQGIDSRSVVQVGVGGGSVVGDGVVQVSGDLRGYGKSARPLGPDVDVGNQVFIDGPLLDVLVRGQ